MGQFLLGLLTVAGCILFSAIVKIIAAPKCPKCGSVAAFQYARKDGGADRRRTYNPIICSRCAKAEIALARSAACSQLVSEPVTAAGEAKPQERKIANRYFRKDIAGKFKEHGWVVYESKRHPNRRSLFKAYIDAKGELQPFKISEDFDLDEYRHATDSEIKSAFASRTVQ